MALLDAGTQPRGWLLYKTEQRKTLIQRYGGRQGQNNRVSTKKGKASSR